MTGPRSVASNPMFSTVTVRSTHAFDSHPSGCGSAVIDVTTRSGNPGGGSSIVHESELTLSSKFSSSSMTWKPACPPLTSHQVVWSPGANDELNGSPKSSSVKFSVSPAGTVAMSTDCSADPSAGCVGELYTIPSSCTWSGNGLMASVSPLLVTWRVNVAVPAILSWSGGSTLQVRSGTAIAACGSRRSATKRSVFFRISRSPWSPR